MTCFSVCYWGVIKGDGGLLGCLVVLEVLGYVTGVLGVMSYTSARYWGVIESDSVLLECY